MPSTQPRAIRGPIRRPEYSVTLELGAIAVECPWCAAVPGSPCSRRREDGTLVPVPVHELRSQAGRRFYRIESSNLDDLADVLEREVRAAIPNRHVGVRLDPNGTVWVRLGFTDSEIAGTWGPAS